MNELNWAEVNKEESEEQFRQAFAKTLQLEESQNMKKAIKLRKLTIGLGAWVLERLFKTLSDEAVGSIHFLPFFSHLFL